LGNLSSLTELWLWNNQLSGPIPAELGNLSSLTGLRLDGNQLSGPIPAELGNLSSLTRLELWNNQLSGLIPAELGNLSSLQYLNIGGNPALVCWQTLAALNWAQGLNYYRGPDAVCPFLCLPVVMSAGG
jgi:Leucine-rich repeat (LRR) protein